MEAILCITTHQKRLPKPPNFQAWGSNRINGILLRNYLLPHKVQHYHETGLSRLLTIHSRSRWASPHPTLLVFDAYQPKIRDINDFAAAFA